MNVSVTKLPLEVLWIRLFIRTLSGKSRLCDKRVSAGSFNFIPHVQRINIGNNFYTEKNIVLCVFPDFDRKCSGGTLKNLQRSSENCIFFQSNFSVEQILSTNLWFFIFFLGILKRTSVGVIKNMVSNCLGDQFWGKTLTRNNSNF